MSLEDDFAARVDDHLASLMLTKDDVTLVAFQKAVATSAANSGIARWWLQYHGARGTVHVLLDVRPLRPAHGNPGVRRVQFSIAARTAAGRWPIAQMSPAKVLRLHELPVRDLNGGFPLGRVLAKCVGDVNVDEMAQRIAQPSSFVMPLVVIDGSAHQLTSRSQLMCDVVECVTGTVQVLSLDRTVRRRLNERLPSSCRLARSTARALLPSRDDPGLLVAGPRVPANDPHAVAELLLQSQRYYLSSLPDVAAQYGESGVLHDMIERLLTPSHYSSRLDQIPLMSQLDVSEAVAEVLDGMSVVPASEVASQVEGLQSKIKDLGKDIARIRRERTAARSERDSHRATVIDLTLAFQKLSDRHAVVLRGAARYRAELSAPQESMSPVPAATVHQKCVSRETELLEELDLVSGELDDVFRKLAWLTRNVPGSPPVTTLTPEEPAFDSFDDVFAAAREQLGGLWLAPSLTKTVRDLEPVRSAWLRKTWSALTALHDYASAKTERLASGCTAGAELASFHAYLTHTDRVPGRRISRTIFSPTESESVLGNPSWRGERILPVPARISESRTALMVEHVKLARNQAPWPTLYFLDDLEQSGLIAVGYIGPHLSNTRTS